MPSAPTGTPTYTFPLDLHGLTASINDGNQLQLVAQSLPFTMWDAQRDAGGDPSNAAPVAATMIRLADGRPAVQLSPSAEFLGATTTQYPVTIDPDVFNVARDGDVYVSSASPTTNFSSDYKTIVSQEPTGLSTTDKTFGYERFHIESLIGKDVLSATLNMYQYATDNYAGSCTNHTTDIYAIAYPRSFDGWTWSNRPYVQGGDMWQNSVASNKGGGSGCPGGNVAMDVTRQLNGYTNGELASYWYTNTDSNKPYVATIELQPSVRTEYVDFCSDNPGAAPSGSPCANSANRPTLNVTYRPLLGMDTATSTFDHRLNATTQVHVNDETGNAMIDSKDLHVAGIGQDLTIDRWYNSDANAEGGTTATSLGTAGWSLGVGPDVYLEQAHNPNTGATYPDRYDYHSADGAIYGHFVRQDTSPGGDGNANDYYHFYEPKVRRRRRVLDRRLAARQHPAVRGRPVHSHDARLPDELLLPAGRLGKQ